jgi:aryl-alcohol dehydrogenase-like predicted oxidoreductase
METRTLGRDGPQLSIVGLGCNMFGPKLDLEATRAVIDAAIDSGITHFDTAESSAVVRRRRSSARRSGHAATM